MLPVPSGWDLREFRRTLKKLVAQQSIPDYLLDYHPKSRGGAPEKLVVVYDPQGNFKADFLQEIAS